MPLPTLTVDIVPVVLFLCALISAAVLVWKVNVGGWTPDRFLAWAAGGVALAAAILLIVLRGVAPGVLSILVGNLCLIFAYVSFTVGMRLARGEGSTTEFMAGAVFGLWFTAAYLAGFSIETRIIIVSAAIIFFAVRMTVCFHQDWHAGKRGPGIIIALVAVPATAVVSFVRILMILGAETLGIDIGIVHAVTVAVGVVATMGVAVVLLRMSVPFLRAPAWLLEVVGELRFVPTDSGEERATLVERSATMPAAVLPTATSPATFAPAEGSSGWVLAQSRCALLSPDGAEMHLTGNEYLILRELAGERDEPVARETLIAAVGKDPANPKDRSVDIIISRLRRKCLEAGASLPVTSVRGRGYVFHGGLRLG